jgi:aminopeptidase-like protein
MQVFKPVSMAVVATCLTLSGCGGGLIAPETAQSNAFLDSIASNCGKQTIGAQQLNYLLNVSSDDDYFIDEASKLSAGEISRQTFASDINSYYPAGDNQAALECIFGLL